MPVWFLNFTAIIEAVLYLWLCLYNASALTRNMRPPQITALFKVLTMGILMLIMIKVPFLLVAATIRNLIMKTLSHS